MKYAVYVEIEGKAIPSERLEEALNWAVYELTKNTENSNFDVKVFEVPPRERWDSVGEY